MSSLRIRSGPLEVRLVTPRSAHQLFRLASDPEVSRYLQWQPHRTLEDSLGYIDDACRLWERRVAFLTGLFLHEDDRLIGATGISQLDRVNHRAEVGTWIGIPYQAQGHNRYAKAAVLRMGFDVLGLHRLELLVRVDNDHSRRSLERMPGLVHEGVQRRRIWKDGVGHDAHMYAITSDRWDPAEWPATEVVGALP